tara:strand:- start:141 stop:584 length:444 start_codon:yes stop_codon:yes gene_type:complete
MQDLDFDEIVALIRKEDSRYSRQAYHFIRQGLDHTVKAMRERDAARLKKSAHVKGPELVDGLRVFALEQYGPMARTVLKDWGITRCADFGELVFNLIEYNVFSKTETDRREDFSEVFTFEEAFDSPFRPAKVQRPVVRKRRAPASSK